MQDHVPIYKCIIQSKANYKYYLGNVIAMSSISIDVIDDIRKNIHSCYLSLVVESLKTFSMVKLNFRHILDLKITILNFYFFYFVYFIEFTIFIGIFDTNNCFTCIQSVIYGPI